MLVRDVLREGMLALHKAGFWLIGHVHDEAISEERKDDETHTHFLMRECMIRKKKWMRKGGSDMPLNAAGMTTTIYRKD